MPLQVYQNRPVVLPFPPRPVVNAETANWLVDSVRQWPHFHTAKNGVVTGFNREPRQQSRSGQTSHDEANQTNDIRQAVRLASVRKSHVWQPLNEYLALTPRVAAPETARLEANSNGKTLPGKILEVAPIMAVAGADSSPQSGQRGFWQVRTSRVNPFSLRSMPSSSRMLELGRTDCEWLGGGAIALPA